jgi:IS30 family transposase
MAIHLNRSRSTINNELKKMADKTYLTPTVQHSLNGTQTQLTLIKTQDKINTYKSLKIYVYRSLLNGYSPDQIAGSIKLLYQMIQQCQYHMKLYISTFIGIDNLY